MILAAPPRVPARSPGFLASSLPSPLMKTLLRAAIAFVIPLALHAQVVVHGTVVDRQTGGPVAGALVRVPATALGTTTSDSGTFTLTSARPISELTVSRVGYA